MVMPSRPLNTYKEDEMGYEEAFLDQDKCRWFDENGYCTNPESRIRNELCDIEHELCMEDGFEWEA